MSFLHSAGGFVRSVAANAAAYLPTAGEQKSAITTSRDLYNELLESAAVGAGVRVTHKTALQASTAFACARVIAEGMSSIPFRLMRRSGRNRAPDERHPLFDAFETAPNEFQTPVEFFDQIGLHLVFTGNAYVWLSRAARDEVIEALPLLPSRVSDEYDTDGTPHYFYTFDDGRRIEIPRTEMWHIRGPSWDGQQGLDGILIAREAIGLSMAQEQHGAATFKNGARISGLLTTDASLNPKQRDELRESWQQTYTGAAAAGKVAVLSHGMKFIQTATSNDHAEWSASRNMQVEEVCRFFRVLPLMVGYSDKTSTYASASAMFDAHVRHTMLPWYRRVEKSADRWLLTRADRSAGRYFKFFPDALLRANPKDRAEFYQTMWNLGAMNANQIREKEDWNPYDGGDTYHVPLNTGDASSIAPTPTPAPTPASKKD